MMIFRQEDRRVRQVDEALFIREQQRTSALPRFGGARRRETLPVVPPELRDAVERFVTLMVDDPARGRVLLIAPEREPVLARSGAEWMPTFIDLRQHKLTRITDPGVQAMVATGLVVALTALFTAYLNGRLATTREQFIDYCVDMLLSRASTA